MDAYQLIVVIGLPRSGKSHWSQQLTNHVVFDDCVTHFYNGKVIDALLQHCQVCINDPRFCHFNTFTKVMKQLEMIVNQQHILLILFENNPQQCLINCIDHPRPGIVNTINKLSSVYDINNYQHYNHVILPVYNK